MIYKLSNILIFSIPYLWYRNTLDVRFQKSKKRRKFVKNNKYELIKHF